MAGIEAGMSTEEDFSRDWDDPLIQLVLDYDHAPNWKYCRLALKNMQGKLSQRSNVDYGDIVRVLSDALVKSRKTQKAEILLLALKCVKSLAEYLGAKMRPYAQQCLSLVLECLGWPEKQITDVVQSTADAIRRSVGIARVVTQICQALNHDKVRIRVETAAFVGRSLAHSRADEISCQDLRMLVNALETPLNGSESLGRFNAAMAIGTAMKLIGKDFVMPLILHLNLVKIAKIKECADRAVLQAEDQAISMENMEKSVAVTEDLNNIFYKSLPRGLLRDIQSSHWADRLTAFRALKYAIMDMKQSEVSVPVIVKLLSKDPGFKDLDRNVLQTRLEIVKYLAEHFLLAESTIRPCIVAIIDIFGDDDLQDLVEITLTAVTEATSLEFMADYVINFATKRNNLTAQFRALQWLSNALLEFGCTMPVSEDLIVQMKKLLAVENDQIRAGAVTLLGMMYLFLGQSMRIFFENDDNKMRSIVEAEFARHAGITPPLPTRTFRRKNPAQNPDFNSSYADGDSSIIEIVIPADQVPENCDAHSELFLPDEARKIVDGLEKIWPNLRTEMIVMPGNESDMEDSGSGSHILRVHLNNKSSGVSGKRKHQDYAISAEIIFDKQFKLSKLQLHNLSQACETLNSSKKTKITEFDDVQLPFDEMPLDVRVQEDHALFLRPEFDSFDHLLSQNDISKLENMEIKLIHDVPPQHNLKTKALPTIYHAEQFKKFAERKKGIFRADEQKILMQNWQKFCEIHDWDVNNPFPFMDLYSKTSPYLPNIENRLKFLQFMAKDLNNRMLHTVYLRFQKLFVTNSN